MKTDSCDGEKVPFRKAEKGETVVITGIAGKFPNSRNVHEFRDNLFNKVDMVTDDHRRWIPFHPEIPQRSGKLFDIEKFDRGFFGATQTQSDDMDPSLRMMLESVIEAIIDAGHNPADFAGTNTAVIIAFSMSTNMNALSINTETNSNDTVIGSLSSMMAGRISYFLKLKGPSFTADTACSSSLYAVDEGYRRLLRGECDKVIVASASLCLHPMVTLQFARLGVLSRDGSSKSFDNAGNGYVRGETIGILLLEKAKNAKRIYAEIVNIKTNCDGYKREGINFPSTDDQAILLKSVYEEIEMDPAMLTYMEAHATGTKVGDPEELNSLDEIFCKGRNRTLHIGGVKSNVGHSEPASGMCSIVKVLICMETGIIPPNLNYKEPRNGVDALVKGRMTVVTEKTPVPDDRGLFGINSFGFGGANAHLLLRWNTKYKMNEGIPADNLPRLVCVQGRTESTVDSILSDVGSRSLDAEYVYLIHQVFRKQLENNLYRGFGVFTKEGEMKRSIRRVNLEIPKLNLVFSNYDKGWLKFDHQLMAFPIFAKTIYRIQNILQEATDFDFVEIFKNPAKENLTSQILGTFAIQISLANVLSGIQLIPNRIIGLGSGELVAAYVDKHLTLKQVVLGVYFITTNLSNGSCKNWEALEKYLPNKEHTDGKWIPKDEGKFGQSSAKYFLNSIVASTNGRDVKQSIPKDGLSLTIGAEIKGAPSKTLHLLDTNAEDPVLDLLSNLGSLYESGFDMEVNKLYPDIELPVSRGTPMISPLINWHQADCDLYVYQNEAEIKNRQSMVHISSKTEDWKFVVGHVIDGRNLFPATGYLMLAWETYALALGKLISEMKIVFEDVKFIRAANIPENGELDLVVTVHIGTQIFEIEEQGVTIVTGKIYEKTEELAFFDILSEKFDENSLCMDEKDIYKELKLRGYHYTGFFRSISKCTTDSSQAIIHWNANWIAFLDCLLQVVILQKDTRNLYVPTSIAQIIIDASKHIEACAKYNDMILVELYKNLNVIRTEGIEMKGLGSSAIARRKAGDPVLEISKFIPNEAHMDVSESARTFVQIVLENTNALNAKVVEVCPNDFKEAELLCPMLQKALDDLPSVQRELIVLMSKEMEISGISVENRASTTESNCLILIVTKMLETTETSVAINAVKGAKGCIISREDLGTDLSKFNGSSFNIICSHTNNKETLVFLRPIEKKSSNIAYVDFSNALDHFEWISKLQGQVNDYDKVVLYSQNDETGGLLGLSTCLQREQYASKIKSVLIMDEAPKFDPGLEFYRRQLDKDMAINVWKDGAWGTYRHLPLPENQTCENEHTYVNVKTKGDLSSLTWLEGDLEPDELQLESDKELIYIYYSALNFRDLMTASGKISPDAITPDRRQQECVQGIEFAGRNSKGQRIMGMCNNGALSSIVLCSKHMLYEIPDEWTMQDASTTVVVYETVLKAFDGLELIPGKSILIHSATGGVGLAAINLSMYYGLEIFVTVGTPEKREFLRKHFPQIKEDHIGNSRDTSFEAMVCEHTNGRGVDFVLNSLAEEKLFASVRCLARLGRFLEIGKFDLANNNTLALKLLEKDAHYTGVMLDKYLDSKEYQNHASHSQFLKLVRNGAIKPLPRTIFKREEVEQAFRFIGMGKHIGKVVIKIRDEEDDRVCPVPRTLFTATPRFFCKQTSSYLICGGLGGFGLELADLLVVRGARNLVLSSKSGLCNGYQKYRIRIWESYGVRVSTTSLDASTEEGCTELLKAANELGPLDGIFNLAVVLRDAFFENQTEENFKISLSPKAFSTKNLDSITRKLCPNLRYFVVFSSISCGRGNAGQTNYGMANSVMERICEKRKKEGYPALAIQWGAIGEVGIVAKMQEDHKELVIGGTLQQRIFSCLEVMDKFLRQDEPIVASMLVAEKKYGAQAKNLFDAVLNIMGISNLKSVSIHRTFPELGMDSMMAVEIKQTLEREYELFLTPQDIKGMTLAKLKDIANTEKADTAAVSNSSAQVEIPDAVLMMLRYIGTEELSSEPVIRMNTLIQGNEEAPRIIVLPGLEGTAGCFEVLCKKLKAHVSCVQFCPGNRTESITQVAKSILHHVDTVTEELTIMAYSFGCVVAVELLDMLEAKGKQARVIFLDGAPDVSVRMTKLYFPSDDENLFQTTVLCSIMMRYMPYNIILKHQEHLMKLNTYSEKINYMIDVAPFDVDVSTKHIHETCVAMYEKLIALSKYNYQARKLKSPLTLFKASAALLTDAASDYNLSSIFENLQDVVTVEGNHTTILENDQLPKEINKILGIF